MKAMLRLVLTPRNYCVVISRPQILQPGKWYFRTMEEELHHCHNSWLLLCRKTITNSNIIRYLDGVLKTKEDVRTYPNVCLWYKFGVQWNTLTVIPYFETACDRIYRNPIGKWAWRGRHVLTWTTNTCHNTIAHHLPCNYRFQSIS